jgi:cell wall-associated NlpC family hydrolase
MITVAMSAAVARAAEEEEETSPSETPLSSVAPSPTAKTAQAESTPIETRKATRAQEGETQYFEPVRPISPGPRSRRRITPRPTPTTERTPSGATTPSVTQTPPLTPLPTETPISRPIPSLPPLIKISPNPTASKAATVGPRISLADIADLQNSSTEIRKIVELGLNLSARNLAYKYASANPDSGGMDCSGFIYYVLSSCGIKDVPRDARDQYIWVRKAGNFQAVLAQRDDTFELDALKSGDLLFWVSNYGISRDPDITQTMIYLGREKGTNQRLMVGASEASAFKGRSQAGVGVFDFKVGRGVSKSNTEPGPVFVGYGRVPGLRGQ